MLLIPRAKKHTDISVYQQLDRQHETDSLSDTKHKALRGFSCGMTQTQGPKS
jgi:hypothetical protein